MKLLVVSTAPFIEKNDDFYAYSPYVKELEIWNKYTDEIDFCCPFWENENDLLVSKIPFPINEIYRLKVFNFKSLSNILNSFLAILINCFMIYKAMKAADHIHLRCPGNIGLLGSFVQILFPNKTKTAKYAGNWDLNSIQPISYKLQKWILSNTFLTRNMQVLVYGEWQNQSKNIKPFFTATYAENEKINVPVKKIDSKTNFVFVGTLSKGKNPLFAIQIIEKLQKKGDVQLDIYGEGIERSKLENYIAENNLQTFVNLHGNQNKEILKNAYIDSHFVILPSKSEGWPKAVAEAMFWGCLPVSSRVSCVSNMLDEGKRGVLLEMNLDKDSIRIQNLLENEIDYQEKVQKAKSWSRNFTTDLFESEIKKFVEKK